MKSASVMFSLQESNWPYVTKEYVAIYTRGLGQFVSRLTKLLPLLDKIPCLVLRMLLNVHNKTNRPKFSAYMWNLIPSYITISGKRRQQQM